MYNNINIIHENPTQILFTLRPPGFVRCSAPNSIGYGLHLYIRIGGSKHKIISDRTDTTNINKDNTIGFFGQGQFANLFCQGVWFQGIFSRQNSSGSELIAENTGDFEVLSNDQCDVHIRVRTGLDQNPGSIIDVKSKSIGHPFQSLKIFSPLYNQS